jgi:hypothetical protein
MLHDFVVGLAADPVWMFEEEKNLFCSPEIEP